MKQSVGKQAEDETPPFGVEKLEEAFPETRWRRPARVWTVNSSVFESGTQYRELLDDKGKLLEKDLMRDARSGDDTVPFASLSVVHDWLGEGQVRVLSAPLRSVFTVDEVIVGDYDAVRRASLYETPPPTAEPRITVFEAHDESPIHGPRHTEVWELEGVSHRFSANDPTFLYHMLRK